MAHTLKDVLNNKYDNHVLPFFWQKEDVTDDVVIDYIQKMYESDIKEFCIESRPFEGFCEEPWWERIALIIKECKKRGMKFWILDDYHFPTGYANGKVKEYEGLNKKVLTYHMINTIGPCDDFSLNIKKPFPIDETAEFIGAVAIGDEDSIVFEKKIIGDYLYFSLPEGRWDIYVLSVSEETDIASDYINMVDKKSCEILINEVYEKHYDKFSDEFGKTIVGFFSDEPGFQNEKGVKSDSLIGKEMPLPWSKEVEEKLIEYFEEDYIKVLPHLWKKINDETSSIRKKYMDIVTTLYKENFSLAIGDWCEKRNVKYIGHIIEDRESHARLGVGVGHFYRSMAGQSMAGSDIISNQLIPGLDKGYHSWARGVWDGEFFHYMLGKMTSSLAYLDPKKNGNSVTEVFGAYGWHEGVKLMKWIMDHLLVRGINNFVPHAFSLGSFPDDDCPPHFYAHGNNPQFRYFNKLMTYTNKMGTLLSNGKRNSVAAIIYHAESEWTGEYMPSQKPAKVLTQNQVEFDIIPNDIFKENNDYQINLNKELVINDQHYSLLVVPYSEFIDDDLYHFILNCENTKVVFLEEYPKGTFSRDVTFSVKNLEKKTMLLSLNEFIKYVEKSDLKSIKTTNVEPYLRTYHYSKDQEYFMLFNEHPYKMIETKIEIPNIKNLLKIDLLNDRITDISNGEVRLNAYESCLIIDGSKSDLSENSRKTLKKQFVLPEEASISFATAKEYPNFSKKQTITQLVDISKKIAPTFCGTIRYEFQFEMEEAHDGVELYLDKVYEIAELTLNGINIGSRICPPYHFYEGKLLKGKNSLILDVTNTLDKEIYEKHSAAQVRQPSGLLQPIVIKY